MSVAATELVALAVKHFGSQKDLAVAMGLGPSGASTVSRWANGVHGLDYEHTMDLLVACGWLVIEGQPAGKVARIEPPDSRLEELAAAARDVQKSQKEILASLKVLLARDQPQQQAGEGRPKRSAGPR